MQASDSNRRFSNAREEDFYRVIDVNLKAPFFVTQAFVRKLAAEKKPGRVINISSVHEDIALPGHTSYCASKGGLRMLMRNLSVELGSAWDHRQQHCSRSNRHADEQAAPGRQSQDSTHCLSSFPSIASAPLTT